MDENDYDFEALAHAIMDRIAERAHKFGLLIKVLEHGFNHVGETCTEPHDELELSAAEEHMERLTLEEFAHAMKEDYVLARRVMMSAEARLKLWMMTASMKQMADGGLAKAGAVITIQEIKKGLKLSVKNG